MQVLSILRIFSRSCNRQTWDSKAYHCYNWDDTTNFCYRTQKIYGDDKAVEQILPKHCTHHKATLWIVKLEKFVGVGKEAFTKLKKEISSVQVLALYDVDAKTKVRSVLMPLVIMPKLKKRHWLLTWALAKFPEYVLGKCVILETDHNPLVPILGRKSLDILPPRVLRFRLHLMQFQYVIQHVPGKTLYTADTLSRAPLEEIPDANSSTFSQEIEQFVHQITAAFPASPDCLDSYSKA